MKTNTKEVLKTRRSSHQSGSNQIPSPVSWLVSTLCSIAGPKPPGGVYVLDGLTPPGLAFVRLLSILREKIYQKEAIFETDGKMNVELLRQSTVLFLHMYGV